MERTRSIAQAGVQFIIMKRNIKHRPTEGGAIKTAEKTDRHYPSKDPFPNRPGAVPSVYNYHRGEFALRKKENKCNSLHPKKTSGILEFFTS